MAAINEANAAHSAAVIDGRKTVPNPIIISSTTEVAIIVPKMAWTIIASKFFMKGSGRRQYLHEI